MPDSNRQRAPIAHGHLYAFSFPALAALHINPKKSEFWGARCVGGKEGKKWWIVNTTGSPQGISSCKESKKSHCIGNTEIVFKGSSR